MLSLEGESEGRGEGEVVIMNDVGCACLEEVFFFLDMVRFCMYG